MREKDALDIWFKEKSREFRRGMGLLWRIAIVLLTLRLLLNYVSVLLVYYPIPALSQIEQWIYQYFFEFLRIEVFFWIGLLLTISTLRLIRLHPPEDIVVAMEPATIHRKLVSYGRRIFYSTIFVPLLLLLANFLAIEFFLSGLAILDNAGASFWFGCISIGGSIVFVIEWQIALITRLPMKCKTGWLLVMPFLVTGGIWLIKTELLWNNFYQIDCFEQFNGELFYLSILMSVLGFSFGYIILRWAMAKSNPTRWWLLIGTWILILPVVGDTFTYFLSDSACKVFFFFQVFIEHIALGDAHKLVNGPFHEYWLYTFKYSITGIGLWLICYYLLTFSVIYRLNNKMPEGYRGVWEGE